MPISYIKSETGLFQCPHCNKQCEKQNTMYYHIKKNHSEDFKYVCEYCDPSDPKKFVQKSAYQQHVANCHYERIKHSNSGVDNPYIGVQKHCPSCDHCTNTKANLLVHYARSHCKDWIPPYNKDVPCKGCGKDFSSSTAYLYHAIQCMKPINADQARLISQIR